MERKSIFNETRTLTRPYTMSATAQKVRRKYYGTSLQRQEMAKKTMPEFVDDIYSLAINGLPLGLQIEVQTRRQELCDEVFDLVMPRYGELFIFFSDKPQFGIITELGYGAYLAEENRGLFLWSFVRWYITYRKNHDSDIARALAEWTGIPEHLQEKAYWGVIKFIQCELIEYHQKQREFTSRDVNITTATLTVNVFNGGNANIQNK